MKVWKKQFLLCWLKYTNIANVLINANELKKESYYTDSLREKKL